MTEARVERRLAAVLAADVVGYSGLIEADETGTLAALALRHKTIVEPLLMEHRGRLVKLMGDGMLVEFASAVDAVQFALDLQMRMAEANAELPGNKPLVMRVGINLGDVIVDGTDIQGDGVNVAARLESMAEPGAICISAGVFEQAERRVVAMYQDLGQHTLKNISRPIRVYRVAGAAAAVRAGITSPRAAKPSIAVLPFTNMSGDPEQEYFSDGITEDIITELSRFHSLFVIARNSSFVYKGRAANLVEVGRSLGVRYIAEGSVRRAGNRVRVTAQLIDTQTGSHMWAERFDRQLEDIFAVQDEVTRRIVTSIAPLIAIESLQLAKRKPPEDMQAYDYYLKAKALVDMGRSEADVTEGRALCDQAIRIDASLGRAHALKAFSYIIGAIILEAGELRERRKLAMQCAEQAVALGPTDSVCHSAVAEAAFWVGQYDRSCSHIARAVSLNPNDADVLILSSYIQAACGDLKLAEAQMEMALERNPSHPRWYDWIRGATLSQFGRYDEAIAALDLYGEPNADVLRLRAVTLVKLGRMEEARAAVQGLLAIRPDFNVGEARSIWDCWPDIETQLAALQQAGLPS